MTLLEKKLRVRKSTLAGAGKGLFTTVPIAKGQRIAEYKGKKMTWAQAQRLSDERNGYVFYFNRNHVIDAWKTRKGIAHYANDARGIARTKGISNNSEYVTVSDRCFIDAARDIKKGEEILVGYGAEYWQAIRYNLRLDLKEKMKRSGKRSRVTNRSKKTRNEKLLAKRKV